MIRLLLVDDHAIVRSGVRRVLLETGEFEVVAETADATEAVALARKFQPDVVVLDIGLKDRSGLDVLPDIRAAGPRVVILSMQDEPAYARQAFERGAQGYVLKTIEADDLMQAIARCMRGESVVSPELTGKLVAALRGATSVPTPAAADPLEALSRRERETLRHLARGASNKEIARALDIAETTVKIHVQHILRKLELGSRVQAAVWASEHGAV